MEVPVRGPVRKALFGGPVEKPGGCHWRAQGPGKVSKYIEGLFEGPQTSLIERCDKGPEPPNSRIHMAFDSAIGIPFQVRFRL